jgi:CRP-like cAMP-binding protein
LTINAIFLIDIALSFVTVVDVEGKLLRDIRPIALHYLRTWFIPDFAGSFPFETVVAQAMGAGDGSLSAMRLIRMIKLVRAAKFLVKLRKLKEREGYESLGSVFGVGAAVFILFFTSHVFGCLFMMLASAEEGDNWLLHYRPDIAGADGPSQYVTALYWAIISITAMGYGDIYPVTLPERLFVILVALVGAVVFSYCLGTISSLIAEVAGIDDRRQQRLRAVHEYLQFRLVPPDVRRRARRFYHHAWKRHPAPYDELAILAELPPPIRAAVLRAVGERALPDLPLLRGLPAECAGFIAARLAPVEFDAAPGERTPIYRRGDPADAMYFITAGEVELRAADGPPRVGPPRVGPPPAGGGAAEEAEAALGRGDTFGELALFPDLAGPLRLDAATARGPVAALALRPAQLADVAAAYPDAARRLRDLAAALAADARARARGAPPPPAAAEGAEGLPACGIAARVRRVRKALVDRLERDLLLPAAARDGPRGPAVLRLLLLPPAGGGGRGGGARGASCAVSGGGEVLAVEHTPEGVAAAAPVSLGWAVPGRPAIRVLDAGGGADAGGGGGGRFAFRAALRLARRAPPPQPGRRSHVGEEGGGGGGGRGGGEGGSGEGGGGGAADAGGPRLPHAPPPRRPPRLRPAAARPLRARAAAAAGGGGRRHGPAECNKAAAR